MFNNYNLQNANSNQHTIKINTQNQKQNQERKVETDKEIFEKVKEYIIKTRKRDNGKIKIVGDITFDPKTDD